MKFNPWNRFKAKIAMFHFFMHLVASLHIAHHLYRGFYLRLSHQCWQKTSLFISYGLMLNLMMQGKYCNFSWGLWSKLVPQGLRWDFLSVCLIYVLPRLSSKLSWWMARCQACGPKINPWGWVDRHATVRPGPNCCLTVTSYVWRKMDKRGKIWRTREDS